MKKTSQYVAFGFSRTVRPFALALGLILPAVVHSQAASPAQTEEMARRQYDSGITFYNSQKYSEALKDFDAVLSSYPNTSVADNALLTIAQYQLEIARDVSAAQTAVDALLKKYPTSDSAPMGHVLAGRIAHSRSHAVADLDSSLASFERVPRLFPGTPAVPAAYFYAGVSFQIARRDAEAIERYRDITMQYPGSSWAANANLSAAISLTLTGRPLQAMEALQRIRTGFSGTEQATQAMSLNTILYRLYVRAPSQPAYAFNGKGLGAETSKLRDVVAIAATSDRVFVTMENNALVFDLKGAQVGSNSGSDLSGIFFNNRGTVVLLRPGTLLFGGKQPVALSIPQADGNPRTLEQIPAAAGVSLGDLLISDRNRNGTIERFSADGTYVKPFATGIKANRLATDRLDNVAALDADQKKVVVFDRDGKQIGQILAKGTGYVLLEPVDIAFDLFGHLYVLDREAGSVAIFNPQWRHMTTFTIAEKSPGAFQRARAFGIDWAGRLYIYNDRAQRVHMYQ